MLFGGGFFLPFFGFFKMYDFSGLVENIQTQSLSVEALGVAVLGVLIVVSVFKWFRRVF